MINQHGTFILKVFQCLLRFKSNIEIFLNNKLKTHGFVLLHLEQLIKHVFIMTDKNITANDDTLLKL